MDYKILLTNHLFRNFSEMSKIDKYTAIYTNAALFFFQRPNLLKVWIFLDSLHRYHLKK
jgi:hypothetical protein